jgi:hypothetical protein
MIRHCVFIRFRADVPTATRDAAIGDIAALQGRMPGIIAVHHAPNTSPETGMDKGYSDGFIVDFDGADARDRYLADRGHQKIGARLVDLAEGGAAGILVYDMVVEP